MSAALKLEDVQPETADPAVVVQLADYRHRRSRAARRLSSGNSLREPELASEPGLYRYSAFGKTLEDTSLITQPLRWKGRWFSPVAGGIYDVRARQWSPELGVFLSVDEYWAHDKKSTLWGWPNQNAVRFSDPSGRLPWGPPNPGPKSPSPGGPCPGAGPMGDDAKEAWCLTVGFAANLLCLFVGGTPEYCHHVGLAAYQACMAGPDPEPNAGPKCGCK